MIVLSISNDNKIYLSVFNLVTKSIYIIHQNLIDLGITCVFLFFFAASERAHWVTPQAAWLPPGSPWKEKEEGESWGPWALPKSQEADRFEG